MSEYSSYYNKKTSLTASILWLCGAIAFLIFIVRGFSSRDETSAPAGCPLAVPERVPTKTPWGLPGVGNYYIGIGDWVRCNSYGKCVAQGISNSCAPTREERRKEMTLVFDALDCGGYDSNHTELQVYPDGTCLFVGNCRPCPH